MITKQDILDEFNEEVAGTRKMLERVPFDKLDFKPSPKSMPLGQLAFMIGSMPNWFLGIIMQDSLESGTFKQPPKPENVNELLKAYDTDVEKVRAELGKLDEKALTKKWSFVMKGKVIMEAPKSVALRQTINHLVHHRAQLGVYLKMNGVAHPSLYGPSGDEQS